MEFRQPADDYGLHRVLEPEGALPQAAEVLDASGPAYVNEIGIDVERLNVDSASFHQIVGDVGRDAGAVGERIHGIVGRRGKMQNPVTGSGGMLLGEIAAVGPDYDGPVELENGDRIATLVSLTLTPLAIEEVRGVDFDADQVEIDGEAYLGPTAPVVPLPEDVAEPLALSVFDVCGAPAQTRRLVDEGDRVLVLGVGKSGMLSAAAARDQLGDAGTIHCLDRDDARMGALADAEIVDDWRTADATRPIDVREAVAEMGDGAVDVVINTCNVAENELSAILPCCDRGTVYFFNMATSFSRATLGAEGVGKDVDLVMGNGYAAGHAEYALELVRAYDVLWEALEESCF
ncbi:MAG: L-erythro-3,5-diaminohexanoate dehydrogenase [Bradymonadaceae bacterium]